MLKHSFKGKAHVILISSRSLMTIITGESCIILIDNWHLLPPLTRRIIWTFMHVDLPPHFHYVIACEDLVLLPMDQVSLTPSSSTRSSLCFCRLHVLLKPAASKQVTHPAPSTFPKGMACNQRTFSRRNRRLAAFICKG